MFRNYFKVALRYLSRHKGYTLINIAGLGVGIACCILIMLFVKSEWSYDRFHDRSGRLYRAWLEEYYEGEIFRNTVTPVPLGPVLQEGIPEAEMTCRVATIRPPVHIGKDRFSDAVTMVDSNFQEVFDFSLVNTAGQDPLSIKNNIILTETVAKKYFGNEDPKGRQIDLQFGNDTVSFNVAAIAKDPPLESTIQFGMLIPFSNASYVWSENIRTKAWSNVSVSTFVLLKEGANADVVNSKIASVMNPLVAKNYKPGEYNIRLQPLHDLHFNNTLPSDVAKPSDPKYAYILSTLGLLVLLIACINFVTLSVGRSATRALEVGVRKVLGAERQQLVRQFWGEAMLMTLAALVLGVLMAILLLKPFNQLANRELQLGFNGFNLIFCLVLLAIIGLLAGMYPALILSRFRPIEVLKGKLNIGGNISLFRKGLIVLQFVASIIMIIGTFTIGRQLNYLQSKDLGFNRDHIVVVSTNLSRSQGNRLAKLFKEEISGNPSVVAATTSLYSMAEQGWMSLGYKDDQQNFRQFRFNAIDADFVGTMGLKLTQGRAFSNNPADSNYILVNEALVKEYGWKDPLGQKLPGKYDHRVLGVVKDFHLESLHNPITPAVLALKPDSIFSRSSDVSFQAPPSPRISVRFSEGGLTSNVAFLQNAWRKVAGDQEFAFEFLDDALQASYEQAQRLSKIVQYASFLSIFIACMGLFGLATLVVVRRTKEIGIRKVLGADVGRIVVLLSRDFILLVLIAALIAFPLAWWALHRWLQDFAYRIEVPWLIFIISMLLAMLVAILTVGIQAMKAALMNPVKSLRTE